jgi:molybdate transport system substrate-binding protein
MRRLLPSLLLTGPLLLAAVPAAADTIKILTAGAYKPVVLDVLPDFEKRTGHKVTVENDTAGALGRRVRSGEAFDVVVVPSSGLEALAAEGKVAGPSIKPLAKVGVGVAVAANAPLPDVGSVEGLRRTLLAARSVAYMDPAAGATSGIYLSRLFEKLGISSEIAKKAVLVRGEVTAERVVRGEAEIALQQASELRLVPSAKFVGMLPAEIQNWTVYAGALHPDARSKEAAISLMAALADRANEPMLKKRGLELP